MPSILANRNVQHQFFIVIADEQTAGYTLFVESGNHGGQHLGDSNAIAAEVDLKLCELNVEYEAKRKSGRLTPLEVRWLRTGAGDQYRAVCVNSGQRDTQFKYLHLQYARECKLDFASLAQAD